MAKRRAEAVACCAPHQNYLARAPPSKRSRSDLERRESQWAALRSEGGAGGNKKRKWMEASQAKEGEEASSASGKRPVRLKGSGSPKERGATEETERQVPQQQPLLLPGMETEAGDSGRDERRSPQQRENEHEDDVCDYNSFQYWRLPLPTLNLSDIEELEKDTKTEARSQRNIGHSEMET